MQVKSFRALSLVCGGVLLLSAVAAPLHAVDGGVSFTNIAAGNGAGITYRRTPNPDRRALYYQIGYASQTTPYTLQQLGEIATAGGPQKWGGAPGVALFDYDNDGDLDIYTTNGPGTNNSLYQSQLAQTGTVSFVDVAVAAGVGLPDHEGSGVCFGDTDNDGDQDLYVLGIAYSNHLFENNGDGTFTDITETAGVAGPSHRSYVGCSMGDINNDGLLDIAVADSYNPWTNRRPTFLPGLHPGTEANLLFLNTGGNVFTDVSDTSGIRALDGPQEGRTDDWSIAMADVNGDGNIDIMVSESTGPAPGNGGGFSRLLINDGTGHFTDRTHEANLAQTGAHMGLSHADYNCDGLLDFFVTDTGSYATTGPSRWYFQNPDGTFTNPGVGALRGTPFGWGVSSFDYDNDGDSDVIYHGGMEMGPTIVLDNPGVLLRNTGNCSGIMSYDRPAVPFDHRPRLVEGVAIGDLNGDGFDDIVSVSGYDIQPVNFLRFVFLVGPKSPAFDPISAAERHYFQFTPGRFTFLDPIWLQGTLGVELNSGGNGNRSAQIKTLGTKGLIGNPHATGDVNRDGIGALVRFTPEGGKTAMRPVSGGASYASQDSLALTFGLGTAAKGTVDVLWPGGVRNRLYDVAAGEKVTLPEIPCDFANFQPSLPGNGNAGRLGYSKCVKESLKDLTQKNVITQSFANRIEASALRAYDAAH
jgi:enediyne biosynthesis protein E4